MLNDLGVDASGMDMVSMHNKLNEIFSRERLTGRRFVLAIDEAQNRSQRTRDDPTAIRF